MPRCLGRGPYSARGLDRGLWYVRPDPGRGLFPDRARVLSSLEALMPLVVAEVSAQLVQLGAAEQMQERLL